MLTGQQRHQHRAATVLKTLQLLAFPWNGVCQYSQISEKRTQGGGGHGEVLLG